MSEREAAEYDEKAVLENKSKKAAAAIPHGCPGHQLRRFERAEEESNDEAKSEHRSVSRLGQWPCQIKLVPVNAPYFNGAKLLIAADCTAYAYANMHEDFMKGKITLIRTSETRRYGLQRRGSEIIAANDIKSVTVVRMEVPCCGGLEAAAKKALQASGKFIPWQVVTLSLDGKIKDN